MQNATGKHQRQSNPNQKKYSLEGIHLQRLPSLDQKLNKLRLIKHNPVFGQVNGQMVHSSFGKSLFWIRLPLTFSFLLVGLTSAMGSGQSKFLQPTELHHILKWRRKGKKMETEWTLNNFTSNSLMTEASERVSLSDYGPENVKDTLEVFARSVFQETNMKPPGLKRFHEFCIHHLKNKLETEQWFKSHPEILSVSIEKPVFVLSFPRSGSTLIQNLIASDPKTKCFQLWELMSPAPFP